MPLGFLGFGRTKVAIDFRLDDAQASICEMLRRLRPVLELPHGAQWELDLSDCDYIGPYAAAVIHSTCLAADGLAQRYRVHLRPSHRNNPLGFSERCGLNHLLYGTPKPPDAERNDVVPLNVIRSASFGTPNPLIDLVRSHTAVSEETEENLRICVSEVVQNVEDHSGSPIGAVCCARYLGEKQRIRVAIVDRGDGICTTLQRQFPEIATADVALEKVIRGGYSAKSRQNNMGVGLSNLWGIITNVMKGQVLIISEDAAAHPFKKSVHRENLGFRFPGTAVFFMMPVVR